MEVLTFTVGALQSNCYALINGQNECVLIDCGGDFQSVYGELHRRGVKLLAVLLTHGHIDHIQGVADAEKYVPVYIFKDEEDFLNDGSLNLSTVFEIDFKPITNVVVFDGDSLEIGDFKIRVIKTAGHTKGSVCFFIDGKLFSGDTVFYGSYGRCDLKSGNYAQIVESVNNILADFPPETEIFPGHGISTTVAIERKINPLSKYAEN
ncbi:MAG: MBL fold metallo-hydrolase [Christensenellaceae bacterium]